MKQVKIFEDCWEPAKLQKKINEWIAKNDMYIIEEIQYGSSERYHNCMIIYTKGIKI